MARQANEAVKNAINVPPQGVPQETFQHDGVQRGEKDAPKKRPELPLGTPIRLALSGGGFRATLFHLVLSGSCIRESA